MSFSPDWLALREPADHAARSQALLAEVAAHFAGRGSINAIDIGCGAGSNLRGAFAALPDKQRWHLVDYDSRLLEAARARLRAWADMAEEDGHGLVLRKGGKHLRVSFVNADLTRDLETVFNPGAELVTAAALFDLVSVPWIADFVAELTKRRLPLYTVLTYDGTDAFAPPHPADDAMRAAFHAHQGGDKGFGPAAGPAATEALARAFSDAGYRIARAPSPWRLGASALADELARGFAGAVRETAQVPEAVIADWLNHRLGGAGCTVGHEDLWAVPA